MHRIRTRLSQFLLLLLGVACSGDELNLPSEGDPGNIEAIGGNGQSGQVGGDLPESLVVRVTDSHDRPIQGQPIEFTLTGDPTGQLLPDTVETDAAGLAASHWQLGTAAGTQLAQARVVGVTGPMLVTFSAIADPAPPDELVLVDGDDQAGQIGDVLPESLVVMLVDQFGNPIADAEVAWATGSGTISSAVVTTGVDGRAAVEWTLGLLPGQQHATATYAGVTGSPVTFTAAATVGPPPRLVIVTQPSGTAASGASFAQQPELQVQDNLGNPIHQSGIAVTATIASGGGTMGGTTTVNTDANGFVQYGDLSITGKTGPRTLIFAASGHTSATSSPINVTASTPSPSLSTVVVAPGSIEASSGSSTSTITVTVKDDSGNPVAGAIVLLAATGGGNQLTQPGPTDANGVGTGSLSSVTAEVKTVTATADNISLASTPSVTVTPGAVDPASSTASVPGGKIFQTTTILVTARDQFGNRVLSGGATVVVTVGGANRRNPFTARDNGDGTYTGSYVPFVLGTDTIGITLNGIAISGSPYTSVVTF
jgi:adhesin/invasin